MTHAERRAYDFPDGSVVELEVRTADPASFNLVRSGVTRRARVAQRLLGGQGRLPTGRATRRSRGSGARQSTTTHSLPDGEVTVSVDASGARAHAYLRTLMEAAVAQARAMHVEVDRAAPLAAALLGGGLALVALGHVLPSVPLFGAGGVVGFHLLVYWLSARGLVPDLARIPEPTDAA